jgi:hypothetical protein
VLFGVRGLLADQPTRLPACHPPCPRGPGPQVDEAHKLAAERIESQLRKCDRSMVRTSAAWGEGVLVGRVQQVPMDRLLITRQ